MRGTRIAVLGRNQGATRKNAAKGDKIKNGGGYLNE